MGRLMAEPDVRIVGCADPNPDAAKELAALIPADKAEGTALALDDHKELIARTSPDALAIFTPHRSHYRPAMDALQAGCHLFIEKPLSTNVQEAADIVNLARSRGRKVGVGHQYRLCPSLVEVRKRLAEGAIGPLRLVTATLTQAWLESHSGPEESWRLDPKVAGGGILADAGDHLIDALLWTTGRTAVEAAAFQERQGPGLDLVNAAAVRLAEGLTATLAISGVSNGSLFELNFYGERGRFRATDSVLREQRGDAAESDVVLTDSCGNIDADFLASLRDGTPLCCPADQAIETVRLLEAIARSAATGQVIRLS